VSLPPLPRRLRSASHRLARGGGTRSRRSRTPARRIRAEVPSSHTCPFYRCKRATIDGMKLVASQFRVAAVFERGRAAHQLHPGDRRARPTRGRRGRAQIYLCKSIPQWQRDERRSAGRARHGRRAITPEPRNGDRRMLTSYSAFVASLR